MVYEVDLDGNVIHIKSLDKPESSPKKATTEEAKVPGEEPAADGEAAVTEDNKMVEDVTTPSVAPTSDAPASTDAPIAQSEEKQADVNIEEKAPEDTEPWPTRFTSALQPFLSEEVITRVKELYLEGPEPPFVSDSGWGGRQTKPEAQGSEGTSEAVDAPPAEPEKSERGRRGKDRGRGGRGGRGRGGRGGRGGAREDTRRVLSDVCNPLSCRVNNSILISSVYSLSLRKRLALGFIKYFVNSSVGSLKPKPTPLHRRRTMGQGSL